VSLCLFDPSIEPISAHQVLSKSAAQPKLITAARRRTNVCLLLPAAARFALVLRATSPCAATKLAASTAILRMHQQATCLGNGAPRARASDVAISCCRPEQGIEELIGVSLSRRISEQFIRRNIRARRPPRYGRSGPVGDPKTPRAHGGHHRWAPIGRRDRVTL
jgi:hypothetical protein